MKKFLGLLLAVICCTVSYGQENILSVKKTGNTEVSLTFSGGKEMLIDFYGENIFRLFRDNSGKAMRSPDANPPAEILVDNPRKSLSELNLGETSKEVIISTKAVKIVFEKISGNFKIQNKKTGKTVVQTAEPVLFDPAKVSIVLQEQADEYFYGGGVQNGRFSHKGKQIAIENENSWTDGGVASPTPFYWSSNGYGFMWYTFKKGKYDFGSKGENKVTLFHETPYLDVFFMVNAEVKDILNDFYQLTGHPVLLPKFGFYQGHLNAYNRDYWKEDPSGILFEDGKAYKESQKDNGGTKESLNGENNNYQFSARAVVDRYLDNDMPLGWILPNDGYGAGYGQTNTLDGNITNLKSFGEYARSRGVEIGLWTQSDLHPKEGISALLQRDIVKEVEEAGVRVLKTDVAWVGAGYSFGLNGVSDVGQIMPKYGNDARPFIISLDGWAGTQRYASIWSGDQTGGLWEYIRFHIPTYIGSGLSGQPNITSDMDGIFGGKKPIINTRDFQWKTFTPMQLNMDGWGANPKYPQALGEPITSINRNYLKLKSELLPYQYSIAKEAVNGLPIIRPMFFEESNAYTQGKMTQYQYMFGPYLLIAPIYQNTHSDSLGNDIRNSIYLPKGLWVDYFSGNQYLGGQIINNFDSPLWKLPVFVKRGAIIPMNNAHNTPKEIDKALRIYAVYPYGNSTFTEYDDDGKTEQYKAGHGTTTQISSTLSASGVASITVQPTKGHFEGLISEKATELRINLTKRPSKVEALIDNKPIRLRAAKSLEDLKKNDDVYYYLEKPDFNKFSTKNSEFEGVKIIKNPELIVKIHKVNTLKQQVTLKVSGYEYKPQNNLLKHTGELIAPSNLKENESKKSAYTLTPIWDKVNNADYYEILFENQLYTSIKDTELLFDELDPETVYPFKIRAVNKSGVSKWSQFSLKTKNDPLEFAIQGISGTSTAPSQPGNNIRNLFDREMGNMWHTRWDTTVSNYDIVINLRSINQLDKIQYYPRTEGRNGNLLKGTVYYSNTGRDWTKADTFNWAADATMKEFIFATQPTARFVKITVSEGVGGFGSGRELYVFRLPGTESTLAGDINHDRLIDVNDLTSYLNYTGLKKGDADFDGYVSKGDINQNGRIDAYDISVVATQVNGGANRRRAEPLTGNLVISPSKTSYLKDETVLISVKGKDLKSVNALGFELPYQETDFEFIGIEAVNIGNAENFSNDRLHTNGEKVLYPTFINVGNQTPIEGDVDLFVIKLKSKRNQDFNMKPRNILLVDKRLETINF